MTHRLPLPMLSKLMNRDELDRWLERGILGLVVTLLVIMPLAFGGYPQVATGVLLDPVLIDPFVIAEWLAVGILVLWVGRFWVKPRPRILWPPVCWAVLAFVVYAVIRYLQADIEYVARQELMRVLVYATVFLAIVNNLHRQETNSVVILSLVLVGMAISFYAIYQFLAVSNHVWHLVTPYRHRATGTYICPNHLGGFLEMVVPLGLAAAFVSRFNTLVRLVVGYAVLVMLAGIAVTVSRGAWLATVAALLLVFGTLLLYRRYRIPSLVLLLVLVSAGAFVLPRSFFLQTRVRFLVNDQGTIDDSARFALWPPAYRMWQDHFWAGAGPGHFDYLFGKYRPEQVQRSPDRVHNDYLNTLTDWGVIGAGLVGAACVLLVLGVARTWSKVRVSNAEFGKKTGSDKFALVLGACAGLLAILCHSFVDFNMQVPANALVAVALMALLTSQLRFVTEKYWTGLPLWATTAASVLLLSGAGYLGYQAWRHSEESRWLAKAGLEENSSPRQIEWLKRAFAVEPMNAQTAYALGEAYRQQSLAGSDDSAQLATTAMGWFTQAAHLNQWEARNHLGLGMCLDWVSRYRESGVEFVRAEELDPNNYFIVAHIGWHYLNLRDYAAARDWLERSLRLQRAEDNPIATNYLSLVNQRLTEAATNALSVPFLSSGR